MTDKTNVMRILDQAGIDYKAYSYEDTDAISGKEVADVLNLDEGQMFKTLVTLARSGENYVFLVPVSGELDLKKAAKAVGEKSIQMIKAKELFPLTGYVHGGCSPIGMKKNLPVIIDSSALTYPTIIFNGGKIGYQVELDLKNLKRIINFKISDLL